MNSTPSQKTYSFDKKREKAPSGKDVTRRAKKSPTAFRTISEVADELGVQQHVLRFWETKFSQVKPLKRGGGRRYYRPEDIALLKNIHHLLYTEGYTIKGVQKLLKGQGKQQIIGGSNRPDRKLPANESSKKAVSATRGRSAASDGTTGLSSKQKSILVAMLGDLKELRDNIKGDS